MSNIGKLKIEINKSTDFFTELKGYKKDDFSLVLRKITLKENNEKNYNQLILSRNIGYDKKIIENKELEEITSEIKEELNENSIIYIRNIKSINLPTWLDIKLEKENNKYKISVENKEIVPVKGKNNILKNSVNSSWGSLRSKIKEAIDEMYITEKNGEYKNKTSLEVNGIGYRIEYKKEERELELIIGYSHKIKEKVPLNIDIKTISQNEIKIIPKYHIYKEKGKIYYNSASLNTLTQYSNKLRLIKPANKDKYKNQGIKIKKDKK